MTNVDCRGCSECVACMGCTECTACTECRDCLDCLDCINCVNCTNCTDCDDCYKCTLCTGLTGYEGVYIDPAEEANNPRFMEAIAVLSTVAPSVWVTNVGIRDVKYERMWVMVPREGYSAKREEKEKSHG